MKVVWRPAAHEDRRRIAGWLAERNVAAAIRVTRALLDAADSLALLPRKGRPGRVAGTRELPAVPPYVIVYEVDEGAGTVRILRVWHMSQDR